MSDEGSMKSEQIRDLDPEKIKDGIQPSQISSGNSGQVINTDGSNVFWGDAVLDNTSDGHEPHEIQKNGTDGNGVINFKT